MEKKAVAQLKALATALSNVGYSVIKARQG
jgi:hypothetical protein